MPAALYALFLQPRALQPRARQPRVHTTTSASGSASGPPAAVPPGDPRRSSLYEMASRGILYVQPLALGQGATSVIRWPSSEGLEPWNLNGQLSRYEGHHL